MRPPWVKFAGLLLVIWAVVGGVIFWVRSAKPTPERVVQHLEKTSLEGKSDKDRKKEIEEVAKQVNQLDYEARREVRMSRKLDRFFRGLKPEEQTRFLDLTLPTGFKQMMEALNRMTPEKRKKFVTKALDDMKSREGQAPPENQPELDANGQKIIEQGFKSFYGEASAEVKMDVAPLIEQLQKNIQGAR